jgi:hypothetical protein
LNIQHSDRHILHNAVTLLMRPWYRLRQFLRAVTAQVTPAERAQVARVLSPAELALFERMPRYDQRHCLDVYTTLSSAGHADVALLRAALLHDIGKVGDDGRPMPLIYYGIFVVLRRLAPALYRWAARSGRGPLRPFAVHAMHDERGARMAAAAGSLPEVVGILSDYAARRQTARTRALGWADRQH